MKRSELRRLLDLALGELDLAARVGAALGPPPRIPVRVVAIGKGAPAMASGAIARWGSAIEQCLVISPDATSLHDLRTTARRARIEDRVVAMRAAHPVPDIRSVRAAAACLQAVSCAEARHILVLISGGASALVCAPAEGITRRTKCAVTVALLRSGAAVQDLNVVRKHLSRIKGGGLARAAGRNSVLTLIASDVIGGRPGDVGSGPSVPDTSTVTDARRALRRFAPSFADVELARASAPTEGMRRRQRVRIIAGPEALSRCVAARLRARRLAVRELAPSQAPTEDMAAEYLVRAAGARGVWVRAAEPSLEVPASAGRGGRSTHLAALVGRGLSPTRRVMFAAFSSDGVDGRSTTGGAIVDEHFAARARALLGPNAIERALARFDTGALHRDVGTAIPAGPTGNNLADVHVLIVE